MLKFYKEPNLFERILIWCHIIKDKRFDGKKLSFANEDECGQFSLAPYYGDIRVSHAMLKARLNDTSFTDKGVFGITPTYSQSKVREIWFQAMSMGMEEGLRIGSVQGQQIDITNGCKNEKHKEFYQKFLQLASEYNCAIVYHPRNGLCVMELTSQ